MEKTTVLGTFGIIYEQERAVIPAKLKVSDLPRTFLNEAGCNLTSWAIIGLFR